MIGTTLLLGFLLIATYTDLRWRVVNNKTTYTGILVALAGSAIHSVTELAGFASETTLHTYSGFVPLPASVAGFLVCGLVMVVSYVLLPGGVGGGDVKLIAMIGAFMGVTAGLESLLWTLVLGGCMALLVLVWREGFWSLLRRIGRYVATAAKFRRAVTLDETDRQALKVELFLSPSALLAVLIVRFGLIEWF